MITGERLFLELRRARVPFVWLLVLFVGGGTASWVILRNISAAKPWEHYVEYRMALPTAKGLLAGRTEARVSGVQGAGTVKAVDLVDGRPVMTLQLKRKYAPLYRDARVRVRPQSPVEDLYVDVVDRGSPRAGVLDAHTILPESQVQTEVEIGRVLGTFPADTRRYLATVIDELSNGLGDRGASLREAFAQLAPFLTDAQRLTVELAERRRNVARLVHNLGGVTDVLGRRDRQLTALVRSGSATLGELARNDGPLAATLKELPPTLTGLRSSFASLRAAEQTLDPTLTALDPVARDLPSGLAALEQFSDRATPALTSLRPAVHDLKPLARALSPTSRSLAGTLRQAQPLTPSVDRITSTVVPCLGDLQSFMGNTLSLLKFGDPTDLAVTPRADVHISLGSAAGKLPMGMTIQQPCFTKGGHR